MKSVLFIVSKSEQTWPDYQFLLTSKEEARHKMVVFLKNGAIDENLHADQVYLLNEGQANKMAGPGENAYSGIPSISYRDLLEMLFASDISVVV